MNRRPAWILSGITASAIAVAVLIVGASAGHFGFEGLSPTSSESAKASTPQSSGLVDNGVSLNTAGIASDDADDEEHGDDDDHDGENEAEDD